MKLVRFEDTVKFENSENCKGVEYPLYDKDINCSTAVITGRYPEKGYCVNEECKELIYVLEGTGSLNKQDEVINFKKDDVILIDKGEVYYWEGNFKIVMPCTPAWYPEQHNVIE